MSQQKPLYVAFTCDTEGMYPRVLPRDSTTAWQVGVEGTTPQGDVGTPLLMQMLEEGGGRGTFFVDVNAVEYAGEDAVRRSCRTLIDRGHDVQLHFHSHSEFVDPADREKDRLTPLPPDAPLFRQEISLCADRFERLCGYRATVYRAGGYRLGPEMIDDLKSVGLVAEATVWPDSRHRVAMPEDLRWRNVPHWYEGMLILPITTYIELYPSREPCMRQLNFTVARRKVYEAVLDLPESQQLGLVSLMAHSSTFMEYGYGPTYREMVERMIECHPASADRLREYYRDWAESDEQPKLMIEKPHQQRIDEFRDFFQELGRKPHLEIITAGEYTRKVMAGDIALPETPSALFPHPCYDFSMRSARMEYVRRYGLDRLRDLDRLYRELPDDQACMTKPPEDIVQEAKAHGIL